MDDNITLRINNDLACLRASKQGYWNSRLNTIVNANGDPIITTTFASKVQAIEWLHEKGVSFSLLPAVL